MVAQDSVEHPKMSMHRHSKRRTMAMDTQRSRILKLNEQFQETARKKV